MFVVLDWLRLLLYYKRVPFIVYSYSTCIINSNYKMDALEIIKKYKGVLELYKKGLSIRVTHDQKVELHYAYQQLYKSTVNIYCDTCVFEMLNNLGNWMNNNLNLLSNEGQKDGDVEASPKLEEPLSDQTGLEVGRGKKGTRQNKRRK